MKITISGMPGSGKSTVADAIEKKLKLKHYYIGQLRREMARKKGITLDQLNKLGEKDPSTDKEVDAILQEIGKKEDNFIMETRTGFFLIPESLKIFINVSIEEGARRIFNDLHDNLKKEKRNESKEIPKTVEEMKKIIQERIDSDIRRYKKYYNIENVYDLKHYDIVIDTTSLQPKETFELTMKKIKEFQQQHL